MERADDVDVAKPSGLRDGVAGGCRSCASSATTMVA